MVRIIERNFNGECTFEHLFNVVFENRVEEIVESHYNDLHVKRKLSPIMEGNK